MPASKALLSYASAWTLGRVPAKQVDYLLIDQDEQAALDESEVALRQTNSVIKAAMAQIVALNAAGLKPEDFSNLWQALSLTAIALRVK